jgi:predicted PurR-regulated permease PerM
MYKVEISPKTIFLTIGTLLLMYVIWNLKELIYSIFIAFILMSALRSPVAWLHKKKIPRTAAVISVYLSFVFVFAFLFSLIIPPIVIESENFIKNIPALLKQINPDVYTSFNIDSFTQYIPTVTENFFKIATGVFSNAVFVISTLFFGFYLLLQEHELKAVFLRFFEEEKAHLIHATIEKAQKQMNAWFWGELTLMTVVGLMTFIGLNIIGMKYALALAVLAGMMEIIPNIGPVLSAVPAVLIGFAQSPLMGGAAIALYIVVQQLENNLIVPIIMKNAVGLNPIITLVALVVGGRVGGVLGVFLAIPAYLLIEVIMSELILKKNARGESAVKVRE